MGESSAPWLVVTGGTKGIGKAVAEFFMREGFDVITCARTQSDLDALQREIAGKFPTRRLFGLAVDLSSKTECQRFAEFALGITDRIDVLVNNTGIFVPGQIHNEADGVLEHTINTNLSSAYHVTRGFLPAMMQRKRGHIFTVCSTASITAYVNGGSYCISKFALLGMTKVLREEMKKYDVRVTAILPGPTWTESWAGTDIPESRFMQPEDVGKAVLACWQLSDQAVIEELLVRPMTGDIKADHMY